MQGNNDPHLDQIWGMTRNRYFGKYPGKVVDNKDPENRGRLTIMVPNLLGTEILSADPCLPFGGKDMGLFMLPEPGAGVWVEFQAGDLDHPIWLGSYWADNESPSNSPQKRMIRSKTGMTISLDDEEEIVTISDNNSDNVITIDVFQGKVTMKGNNTVVIEAPNVQLGEGASDPVVKGTELYLYLTSLALMINPTSPPIPPPTMLSLKVKTA